MTDQQRIMGCLPSPDDPRDWQYESLPLMTASPSFPETFDLRPYLPPVRDQGALGTCAAFSAACIKEYHEKIDNPDKFNFQISPFFIYYFRVNKPSEGMNLRNVMQILTNQGACREQYMPYGLREPKSVSAQAVEDGARFKISGYAQVSTINAAKAALMNSGPILFAFPYYENKLSQFWRPKRGLKADGGHAVVGVGWTQQGFIIRNSWGSGYADHGYVIYDFAEWGSHFECWSATDQHTIWPEVKTSEPVPEPPKPEPVPTPKSESIPVPIPTPPAPIPEPPKPAPIPTPPPMPPKPKVTPKPLPKPKVIPHRR